MDMLVYSERTIAETIVINKYTSILFITNCKVTNIMRQNMVHPK